MTYAPLTTPVGQSTDAQSVRTISVADLGPVLKAGLDDFWAMPTHTLFLVIIYPVIGLVIARVTLGEDLLQLAYPLVAGFALLGPFAAIGLYELSRRREQGLDVSWSHALDVLHSPSFGSIAALGALLMAIFVAWIAVAHGIYTGLFGALRPHGVGDLLRLALTTPRGWSLILLGNGIGFVFAAAVLTLSAVSFPLLLDRPVGVAAAIRTSVRAVQANPLPMAAWGAIVAAGLAVGCATLFIGLAIVLPVLGHATWHLYRLVVVPRRAS